MRSVRQGNHMSKPKFASVLDLYKHFAKMKKKNISSHELAKFLLTFEDLPVVIVANDHVDDVGLETVGLMDHHEGRCICIGNYSQRNLGAPNWSIKKTLMGDPVKWGHKTGKEK